MGREEVKQKGLGVRILAVDVGCRDFPAQSLTVLLTNHTRREKTWLKLFGDLVEEASSLQDLFIMEQCLYKFHFHISNGIDFTKLFVTYPY